MPNGWQPVASCGSVDEMEDREYSLRVMKLLIFRTLALTAVLASAGRTIASDDLDKALEAQKKKAPHRVYSESAQIANPNLSVPKTESEEERQLDKKLQEMEAKMDIRQSPTVPSQASRTVTVAPRATEDKNWLITAVLSDLEAPSITNETEDSWLTRELARQKETKEQDALLRENEQADKLLRERAGSLQNQLSLPDPLKKYQLAQPDILGGGNRNDDSPAYMTPQSGIPDPLSAMPWAPKKDKPAAPALFSPEAARIAASPGKDSLHPELLNVNPGASAGKSSSVFSYGRRDDPEPVPLTPLEMIKKSSPINRPNPFADDHMPEFKNSIWQ